MDIHHVVSSDDFVQIFSWVKFDNTSDRILLNGTTEEIK